MPHTHATSVTCPQRHRRPAGQSCLRCSSLGGGCCSCPHGKCATKLCSNPPSPGHSLSATAQRFMSPRRGSEAAAKASLIEKVPRTSQEYSHRRLGGAMSPRRGTAAAVGKREGRIWALIRGLKRGTAAERVRGVTAAYSVSHAVLKEPRASVRGSRDDGSLSLR